MLFTALQKPADQYKYEQSGQVDGELLLWKLLNMCDLTCMRTLQCRWLLDFVPPSSAYLSVQEMKPIKTQ